MTHLVDDVADGHVVYECDGDVLGVQLLLHLLSALRQVHVEITTTPEKWNDLFSTLHQVHVERTTTPKIWNDLLLRASSLLGSR